MTDLSLIQNELVKVMGVSESDIEKYQPVISSAGDFVSKLLISDADINSVSIVHLCAAKAYYQILLLNGEDGFTSFKAGDVSYTRASSALEGARQLYEEALTQCASVIKNPDNKFFFGVV